MIDGVVARSAAPLPPSGGGLATFWSSQKAAVLRTLPSAQRRQLDDTMKRDLSPALARLTKLAAAGDTDGVEAQGWAVSRTLRVYKVAVLRVLGKNPEPKSWLLAAIAGVAASVDALLPSPGAGTGAT